eukprot:GGOE01036466.1.p1 GENE.GGOE01036466.1~~GGOE01036466.1.p1  ORF type:complete len:210 (-),score=35.88 GGOE01036466.1:283-870(-)
MVDGVDVAVVTLAIGLNCISDICTQYFTFRLAKANPPREDGTTDRSDEARFVVDWKRTGRWCLWPAAPSVLVTAFTFGRVIPALSPPVEDAFSVTLKVLLRVLSHSVGAFLGMVGNRLLAGDKSEAVVDRLREFYVPCAVAHCGIWLPADLVQFLLIEPQFQVLWIYSYNLIAGVVVCYFVNIPLNPVDMAASAQ